jgi:uncharacterized protein
VTRVFFWLLLGALVYAGLRKLAAGRGDGGRPPVPPAAAPRAGAAENMVRCRVCGLNLPESEALRVGPQWACCAEHARTPGAAG